MSSAGGLMAEDLGAEEREREAELTRLIKRAVQAGRRSWCGTTPRAIATYLIEHGVTVPVEREVS